MSSEVAHVLKMALKNVVERGTAQRIKNVFISPDGAPLEIGEKKERATTGLRRFAEAPR